jgi:hypothetical protein
VGEAWADHLSVVLVDQFVGALKKGVQTNPKISVMRVCWSPPQNVDKQPRKSEEYLIL